MGAEIIPIIRPEAVDAAWQRFQAQSLRLIDNPRLYSDRSFMEELARREREWKHRFWANEA